MVFIDAKPASVSAGRYLSCISCCLCAQSRPDVHDLLKMPVFAARVPQFLTNQIIDDEFSHTVCSRSCVLRQCEEEHLAQKLDCGALDSLSLRLT